MSIINNLEEAQKKVKELQDELRNLTNEPSALFDTDNLSKANAAIETLTKAVAAAKKEANDLKKGFSGVFDEVVAIVGELKKQNKEADIATKAFKSIQDITQKLKYDEQDISKLNIDQLESLKKKLKSNQQEIKDQAEAIKLRLNLNNGTEAQIKADIQRKLELKQITEEEIAILNGAKEGFKVFEEINNLLDERIKKEKEINKKMGMSKLLMEGMGKIPIVGPLLDTNKALDAAREKAEAGGSSFAAMGAGLGSMAKSLVSSLGDPLVVVGLLVKGFKMFMELGFAADKQITDLSKSMAVSHEEASATRDRMVEIQNSGKDIFMTTKNQVAAQMELASAMGATRGFTEQQIADQVTLTKKMGLTAEEAGGIQMLAASNGVTAKDVTGSIIKQTAALAKQTGIQLDNKQVVQEVAKVSGQLRLQYANNPKLIAKAVVETKKLGINMEIAANAAKGLLDFESSIENELSAELLTGKALNLERARGLALNGDSVGAAKEMLAQVGSAAEFANMNVIQQEAIAKAVGMSTDDLANSLVTQENLKNLGDETRKQVEEEIEAAKKLKDMDKVRTLEASIGNEEEAKKALEKVSAQEKFNQAIETLKSMLASIVEGPAAGILNWLTDAENGANNLKKLFNTIKGIIAVTAGIIIGKMVFGLATAVGSMIAQVKLSKQLKAATQQQAVQEGIVTALKVTGAEASTLGTATPLILGGLAAVMAGVAAAALLFNKGGSVPGTNTKTDSIPAMLTSGEYVIPNSNGMTGTEKYKNLTSNQGNNKTGGQSLDLNPLITAINGLRSDIKALASRPIHISVQMDGKEIATAQGKYPKEAGDANRVAAFRV